jgi:hypothetical protein
MLRRITVILSLVTAGCAIMTETTAQPVPAAPTVPAPTPSGPASSAPAAPARDGNIAIREELDAARKVGTVEAYDLFLARHPGHPLAETARLEREKLAADRPGAKPAEPAGR